MNAVKHGLGFNGALHCFTLDGLADDGSGVVVFDGRRLRDGRIGLAGIAGIAVAEVGAASEGNGGDRDEGEQA